MAKTKESETEEVKPTEEAPEDEPTEEAGAVEIEIPANTGEDTENLINEKVSKAVAPIQESVTRLEDEANERKTKRERRKKYTSFRRTAQEQDGPISAEGGADPDPDPDSPPTKKPGRKKISLYRR